MFFAVMKGNFMLKGQHICFLLGVLFWSLPTYAETSVIEDYLANMEQQASARASAKDLLKKQPQRFEIKKPRERLSVRAKRVIAEKNTKENPFAAESSGQETQYQKETANDEVDAIEEITFAQAPFDLFWGASLEYMQHHLGWKVQKVEREGYKNVYQMKHDKHPQNSFSSVSAVFGENNKLWCIFAEGEPLDDDAGASQILALYEKYYEALNAKYGNAEVHFAPYTYEIEQPVVQNGRQVFQNGRPVVQIITMQNPLGGENFLQELQEGKASLYSTFHNDEIGVTLSLYVDDEGKSHLLLDYKNLPLMENEKSHKMQSVMEGL